jgi:hypothetical protein
MEPQGFIAVFKETLYWTVSRSAYSRHVSERPILILSSHLRLRLPSGLFLWSFQTADFRVHVTYHTHVIFPLIITTLSSHYAIFCPFPIFYPGPNNFLSKSDIMVQWLTLLIRIREVPVSNLCPETCYLDRVFVVFPRHFRWIPG